MGGQHDSVPRNVRGKQRSHCQESNDIDRTGRHAQHGHQRPVDFKLREPFYLNSSVNAPAGIFLTRS